MELDHHPTNAKLHFFLRTSIFLKKGVCFLHVCQIQFKFDKLWEKNLHDTDTEPLEFPSFSGFQFQEGVVN